MAVQAIPFLLIAIVAWLVLAPLVRARPGRAGARRAPRRKRSTLRSVPRSRMDDELQDLIRRG